MLDPSRPLNRLQDRVALITGAASGIGRATAILFASEGARVAASDRTLERLSSLARELEQSDARGHLMVAGDVTSGLDVRRVVQETTSKLGPVDILCNIAGVLDRALLAHELPDEVWARVLGVNLTAPFLFAREVLGSMLERNSGVIICISSGAGLGGGRAGTAYTVAKHGVIGLGRSLAAAYGQAGIRSVVICPGAVTQPTGSVEGPVSSLGAAMIARRATTRPRDATPEQIARVILFAASDEASHVNGATLTVDGGWSAI